MGVQQQCTGGRLSKGEHAMNDLPFLIDSLLCICNAYALHGQCMSNASVMPTFSLCLSVLIVLDRTPPSEATAPQKYPGRSRVWGGHTHGGEADGR
jgi:hypothetical protein